MAITKRILIPQRRRSVPPRNWSWIDRRFLREHADALGRDAILLYFFLAAVADQHGLSYYSDSTLGARLRMEADAVVRARDELVARDLVAYQSPLYQVLSLPEKPVRRSAPQPEGVGDILAAILRRSEEGRDVR